MWDLIGELLLLKFVDLIVLILRMFFGGFDVLTGSN